MFFLSFSSFRELTYDIIVVKLEIVFGFVTCNLYGINFVEQKKYANIFIFE